MTLVLELTEAASRATDKLANRSGWISAVQGKQLAQIQMTVRQRSFQPPFQSTDHLAGKRKGGSSLTGKNARQRRMRDAGISGQAHPGRKQVPINVRHDRAKSIMNRAGSMNTASWVNRVGGINGAGGMNKVRSARRVRHGLEQAT